MNKIYYSDNSLSLKITQLIDGLPLIASKEASFSLNPRLVLTPQELLFYDPGFKVFNFKTFYQSFINSRLKNPAGQLLIQAVKMPNDARGLDLTGGLARDSLLLAAFGYKITLLENNPFLIVILRYLLNEFPGATQNINIIYQHAGLFLQNKPTNIYDFIYYDPMFNQKKAALPKREMQIIDKLIQEYSCLESLALDFSHENLLNLIIQNTKASKLIVKRDDKQEAVFNNLKPTYSKLGKTIRYDIYQLNA